MHSQLLLLVADADDNTRSLQAASSCSVMASLVSDAKDMRELAVTKRASTLRGP